MLGEIYTSTTYHNAWHAFSTFQCVYAILHPENSPELQEDLQDSGACAVVLCCCNRIGSSSNDLNSLNSRFSFSLSAAVCFVDSLTVDCCLWWLSHSLIAIVMTARPLHTRISEVYAALVAALCHDAGHDGCNNPFHCNTAMPTDSDDQLKLHGVNVRRQLSHAHACLPVTRPPCP